MASVASEDRELDANQRADQGRRHDARVLRAERSSKLMNNRSTYHVAKVRFPGAPGFGGATGADRHSPDRSNNRSKSKPSTEAPLDGNQEANTIVSAGLYSKLKREQQSRQLRQQPVHGQAQQAEMSGRLQAASSTEMLARN